MMSRGAESKDLRGVTTVKIPHMPTASNPNEETFTSLINNDGSIIHDDTASDRFNTHSGNSTYDGGDAGDAGDGGEADGAGDASKGAAVGAGIGTSMAVQRHHRKGASLATLDGMCACPCINTCTCACAFIQKHLLIYVHMYI